MPKSFAGLFVASLVAVGCGRSPSSSSAPEVTAEKPAAALQPQGWYGGIARLNAGNGEIEVVIADHPISCASRFDFPDACEAAWRIRFYLPVERQRSGPHALGEGDLFAYRDAQAPPAAGPWGSGAACQNLGGQVTGELVIGEIDHWGISGTISDGAGLSATFDADRCPSCKGTGMACSTDAECCNDFCDGSCQP